MARARSLTEFQETFPDEASCAAFLFDRRWPDGFICPVSGNGRAADPHCWSRRSDRSRHQSGQAKAKRGQIPRYTIRTHPPCHDRKQFRRVDRSLRQGQCEARATLLTDGHASYPGLTDYRHDPRVVGKMAAHVVLPWIHRVFALMKRWGLGTYHGLRRKHIDTYLNEFVFRYNRRFYRHSSFETMLGIAAHHEPA